MELMIAGKIRELTTIKPSQFKKLLHTGENILVFGASGIGKSAILEQYAEETGKKLVVISLAMEMPETIGGIPYAQVSEGKKTEYFTKLINDQLASIFEKEGENVIIFFDEINQAAPEVLNALYGICHPDPKQRQWNGHSLAKAQIVAAGNKSDGSDGTVYLTDLPVPLLNRFFIAEMVADKTDTMKYLKEKWKNIPQVAKYIDTLLKEDIPPRDIEQCLKIIAYDYDGLLLQMKIGSALTEKLYDIQKKVKSVDPAEALLACREGYKMFKDTGKVMWAGEYITEEEDLLERFKDILNEEEIKSIVKGDE